MRKLTYSRKTSIVLHTEDYLNAGLTQDEMVTAIYKNVSREKVWMISKYPINYNIQIHIQGHSNDFIEDIIYEIENIFEKLLNEKQLNEKK